ncbi:hypothetical protein O3P69_015422 [Scylla paramamosain]|uniref:Secreted protein n=1 Tax=Scylla paramamosain TaxID=85552 RepID=A0AAW0T5H4_SCYPA
MKTHSFLTMSPLYALSRPQGAPQHTGASPAQGSTNCMRKVMVERSFEIYNSGKLMTTVLCTVAEVQHNPHSSCLKCPMSVK